MKREIKFKSYVKHMDGSIKSYIWLPFSSDEQQEANLIVHNESVIAYGLQYTGLKDKNGKEIYEGDILRCVDGALQEVYFDSQGAFACRDIKTEDILEDSWMIESDDEVIGNIYENPELL